MCVFPESTPFSPRPVARSVLFMFQLNELTELDELAVLVRSSPGLCVRYSTGPDDDARDPSVDYESGLELPGLSVNPLDPESWWTRPLAEWLARQLCQYRHLAERDDERFAWTLRGRQVARGPDCEPILVDIVPVARLSSGLLAEAERLYTAQFDAHRDSVD